MKASHLAIQALCILSLVFSNSFLSMEKSAKKETIKKFDPKLKIVTKDGNGLVEDYFNCRLPLIFHLLIAEFIFTSRKVSQEKKHSGNPNADEKKPMSWPAWDPFFLTKKAERAKIWNASEFKNIFRVYSPLAVVPLLYEEIKEKLQSNEKKLIGMFEDIQTGKIVIKTKINWSSEHPGKTPKGVEVDVLKRTILDDSNLLKKMRSINKYGLEFNEPQGVFLGELRETIKQEIAEETKRYLYLLKESEAGNVQLGGRCTGCTSYFPGATKAGIELKVLKEDIFLNNTFLQYIDQSSKQ